MSESGGHSLAIAFDTDDPEFCRGWEGGLLYARVEQALVDDDLPADATVHISNSEMVMRIAESLGVTVQSRELDDSWMQVRFDR